MRIEPTAQAFMPITDIPLSVCPALSDFSIGDKIKGDFTYEVLRKDEFGAVIRIKSMNLESRKRIQ